MNTVALFLSGRAGGGRGTGHGGVTGAARSTQPSVTARLTPAAPTLGCTSVTHISLAL